MIATCPGDESHRGLCLNNNAVPPTIKGTASFVLSTNQEEHLVII